MRLPPSPLNAPSFAGYLCIFLVLTASFWLEKLGADPGLGWHLRTGELIAATGSVPMTDPFLAGFEGVRWISNQWLADLLFYGVYDLGSWAGVHFLSLSIGVLAYFAILPQPLQRGGAYHPGLPAFPQNIALALAALCGAVHWISRPVIFSLLCFSITLVLIRRHRLGLLSARNYLLSLAALFAVWANLHPAFVLGLALLGLHTVVVRLDAPRLAHGPLTAAAGFAVASVATLLNPNGFDLHRGAVQLGSSSYFMNLNNEWLSPTIGSPIVAAFFVSLLLVVVVGALRPRVYERPRDYVSYFDLAAFMLFTICALKAARFIPFFGLVAFPVLAFSIHQLMQHLGGYRFLSQADYGHAPRFIFIPVALLLGLLVTVFRNNEETFSIYKHFSKPAIDAAFFLEPRPAPGKVLHSPNYGGAIIWATYPDRVALIDDRNELNGEQAYRDFLAMQNLEPRWHELFTERNFLRALLYPSSPLASVLAHDPQWKELYRSEKAVVFERIAPPARCCS